MTHRLPRSLLAAAVAGCVLLLVACGSSSKSSSSASSGTSGGASAINAALKPYLTPPTKLPVTKPLSRKPPVEKDVFLNNGVTIAQQISAGLASASATLGWKYSSLSVNQNNPSTIPSDILSAINSGANVVFVSATQTAVFKSALPVARQKKVAIVDIASGNTPTPGVVGLVDNSSQNGPTWGKLMALGALRDGGKRKLLLVTVPAFATILGATDQSAQATVTKYCPSCSLSTLDISPTDLFGGKAPQDVVSYLQSHPGITEILQDSSLTDPGLTAALKAASMTNIEIYGVAPTAPQYQEVASGQEAGWVAAPLQVTGWMAVDAAARYFTGGDPAAYDHAGFPAYLLTKRNPPGPSEFPEDYETQFKHMWHIDK